MKALICNMREIPNLKSQISNKSQITKFKQNKTNHPEQYFVLCGADADAEHAERYSFKFGYWILVFGAYLEIGACYLKIANSFLGADCV